MPVRSVGLILIPLIAVGLAAALLLTVRSSAQSPAARVVQGAAQPPAQSPAAPPLLETQPSGAAPRAYSPAPVSAALPAPAAAPMPPRLAGYVALIDNSLILRSEFDLVQSIDQAMSALLGIEPAAPDQLLQQMVNHRLVMREATRAGAQPGDAHARLAELLAANKKTQADLDAILQTYAVDAQQFEGYLAELVLVDQFAHQAAVDNGMTVEGYVAQLQAGARIHLGDPLTATEVLTAPVTGAVSSAAAVAGPSQPDAPTAPAASLPTAFPTPSPAASPTAAPEEKRGIVVGQLAPLFELETLGGADHKMRFDDLLGKPTVLSFWTTWCPYCLRQTPVLVVGAGRYAAGDVQFVGIDVSEQAPAVAAYVSQHAIPYPVLLDTAGETAGAYGVDGYPTTYFLDADGRIVAHQIGAMSDEQLTSFVEQLLSKK